MKNDVKTIYLSYFCLAPDFEQRIRGGCQCYGCIILRKYKHRGKYEKQFTPNCDKKK